MKKVYRVSLLLVALMTLMFTACGAPAVSAEQQTDLEETRKQAEANEAQLAELKKERMRLEKELPAEQ